MHNLKGKRVLVGGEVQDRIKIVSSDALDPWRISDTFIPIRVRRIQCTREVHPNLILEPLYCPGYNRDVPVLFCQPTIQR